MESELKPRLCSMVKGENGYGFHLHGEKGKSGQYIRKVEPESPAEASGLRAGDRVVEVNGENVEKETHHQVVQRIKVLEHETRLLVVDRDADEYLRSLRLTCTEEMAIQEKAESPASASPATPSKRENGSVSKLPRSPCPEEAKPSKRSPSRAGKKVGPRHHNLHHYPHPQAHRHSYHSAVQPSSADSGLRSDAYLQASTAGSTDVVLRRHPETGSFAAPSLGQLLPCARGIMPWSAARLRERAKFVWLEEEEARVRKWGPV
ncbi:hypothetical protein SKAU_G00370660 [Synaphobranchus kaupii]|uniref:PDZ domain-containing protein n=1 Tax=Synaphobranchus kaupii TaxID=118154 RepID=A0A9Q1IEY8_SYNKA|nr:hypothetical protein SKAU_G00370660 [Synaphobranchus kaupii]